MDRDQLSLFLAVEGPLDEVLLRKLLSYAGRSFSIIAHQSGGCSYLQSKVNDFNRSAKGIPFIILTDLDRDECAPIKIRTWFSSPIHGNLLFRIAVRTIEAWLMADREGMATFLHIPMKTIPEDVEKIEKPKQMLIQLAGRSRLKAIREGIVPAPRSTSKQGPNYNGQMSSFVMNWWDIDRARIRSDSLQAAIDAIKKFKPTIKPSGI